MKKTAVLLIVVMMVFCIGIFVQADDISQIIGNDNTVIFIDVPAEHWARNEINYFASQGIVTGIGNQKFDPDGGVTREQFAKMLVLAFKAPISIPEEPTFSDVSVDKWSYPYVETCKEFMTGYANIFGGKPTFHPEEYATREDIAVALVRMMGLTAKDVDDAYYAYRMFSDADSVSPQLLEYVSLAAERKLISGYPDGTFGPTRGITRAEAVSLINRATKQAVTDINAELELYTNVVTGTNQKEVTIMIQSEEGTKVTVDGQNVIMLNDGYGQYEGVYLYEFIEEGSKTFMVEGKKNGKSKMVEVTAKYEIGLPLLNIMVCPTNVTGKEVTIEGTMYDENYATWLTINGENVATNNWVGYTGSWSKAYTLEEGENTFEFVLTNEVGKTVTETRVINFAVDGPELVITVCPTSVSKKQVTIEGTMYDKNYSTTLTINGESVASNSWSGYTGNWSKTFTLEEGENTFEFVLTNGAGKSVTKTKVVNFAVDGPELVITVCPTSVSKKQVTIEGTMYDKNYSTTLTINGESVASNSWSDYTGNWSKTFTLEEGENTFEFVLTNEAGKTTVVQKTITFIVGSPEITFTNCPEVTDKADLYIQGRISGETDGVKLYIDDEEVSLDYNKNFTRNVTLNEGDNVFVFRAINSFGKSTSLVKTIKYAELVPPILTVNDVEASSSEETITITGNVSDALDSAAEVRVNDKVVSKTTGDWSATVMLKEGSNDIIITASNKFGRSVTIVKKVIYTVPEDTEKAE